MKLFRQIPFGLRLTVPRLVTSYASSLYATESMEASGRTFGCAAESRTLTARERTLKQKSADRRRLLYRSLVSLDWHVIASISRHLAIFIRWHLGIFVRWYLSTFRWLHSALIGVLIWRFKLFRGDRRFRFFGDDWRSRLIRSGRRRLFICLRVGAWLSEAQTHQGRSKRQTQLGHFALPEVTPLLRV